MREEMPGKGVTGVYTCGVKQRMCLRKKTMRKECLEGNENTKAEKHSQKRKQ